MKKWYCPNCKVFKRFKKTQMGFMGYPDTYHCRCCGAELVNTKRLIEQAKVNLVKEMVEEQRCVTN